MPLLVRGGGGGKKIKDATAVPSDVAAGKVFYNNNGRQVGSGMSIKTLSMDIPETAFSVSLKRANLAYLYDLKTKLFEWYKMATEFSGYYTQEPFIYIPNIKRVFCINYCGIPIYTGNLKGTFILKEETQSDFALLTITNNELMIYPMLYERTGIPKMTGKVTVEYE